MKYLHAEIRYRCLFRRFISPRKDGGLRACFGSGLSLLLLFLAWSLLFLYLYVFVLLALRFGLMIIAEPSWRDY